MKAVERQRQTERQRQRDTERETERDRERQRERERERWRERESKQRTSSRFLIIITNVFALSLTPRFAACLRTLRNRRFNQFREFSPN